MRGVALWLGMCALGCGGARATTQASSSSEPAWEAMHNSMVAMGATTSSPSQRGRLPAPPDWSWPRVTMTTDRCYTFFAAAVDTLEEVHVALETQRGREFSGTEHERFSTVHVCPNEDREVRVVVEGRGEGSYRLAWWETARPVRRPPTGTCADPIDVEVGEPMRGITLEGQSRLRGGCADSQAPERVYRLRLERPSVVRAYVDGRYDAMVYVRTRCSDAATELACNDDAADANHAYVARRLDAGTYYIIVDGWQDRAGAYELTVQAEPVDALDARCAAAATLSHTEPTSGAIGAARGDFEGICDSTSRSGEMIYRLVLDGDSRVRLRYQAAYSAALYVRSECLATSAELACRVLDARNAGRADMHLRLAAGTYWVFADARGGETSGRHVMDVETVAAAGDASAQSNDSCTQPVQANAGQTIALDTFRARDDYAGSCGGEGGADLVYRIDTPAPVRINATLKNRDFRDAALYLRSACADAATELACASTPEREMRLGHTVGAGTYYLIVDGDSEDAFGAADLDIRFEQPGEEACNEAPSLPMIGNVSGDTRASPGDRFQPSCSGARSRAGDMVHRLRVVRRSVVRLVLAADYDATLALRSTCVDATGEIACNDDWGDPQHSYLERTLDPGMYYVVVDGVGGQTGMYTLGVLMEDAPQ